MTTGFGVAAFYPEPISPQYPISKVRPVPESCYKTPESQQTAECQKLISEDADERQAEQVVYEERQQEYANKNAGYTRTAIFLGVLVGAMYAIFGLYVIKQAPLVANGFLWGAVLTAVLTRLLISLASLGSSPTGTEDPSTLAYIEFFLLVVATVGVTFVGAKRLSEANTSSKK